MRPESGMRVIFHNPVGLFGLVDESAKDSPTDLLFLGRPNSFLLSQIIFQQKSLGLTTVFTLTKDEGSSEIEELRSPGQSDVMMRRYMMINKAKTCDVFGIIVVNSFVKNGGKNEIRKILDILAQAKKKAYVFTMSTLESPDKLNEPKVKNFSDVQAFVILSCPKSSLFDYKDLYSVLKSQSQITLTPHELLLALGVLEWDSNLFFGEQIPLPVREIGEADQEDQVEKKKQQLVAM